MLSAWFVQAVAIKNSHTQHKYRGTIVVSGNLRLGVSTLQYKDVEPAGVPGTRNSVSLSLDVTHTPDKTISTITAAALRALAHVDQGTRMRKDEARPAEAGVGGRPERCRAQRSLQHHSSSTVHHSSHCCLKILNDEL